MDHRKIPNLALAIVVIASLLVGASGATSAAVPAPDVAVSAFEREATRQGEITAAAAPTVPTDESQVPHYFGPNTELGAEPVHGAGRHREIVIGDGAGATAVASVGANGTVTGITLTSPGSGYTAATVNITGAGTVPRQRPRRRVRIGHRDHALMRRALAIRRRPCPSAAAAGPALS